MKVNSSRIWSTYFLILCISTLIYIEPIMNSNENNGNPKIDLPNDEITNYIDFEDINDYSPIKQELIPGGDFETFAFFSGGGTEAGTDLIDDPEYPNDPENNVTAWYPNVVEWVTYDEIRDGGHIPKELYWRALSTEPDTWPSTADVWHQMRERSLPHEPSKMFSPVFTEDWEISGRVHYLTYIQTNNGATFSETITVTMRFSIHLYEPINQTSTMLTNHTFVIPNVMNYNEQQRTFYSDIPEPVNIPAGYRLKYDIEYMFSSIPSSGSLLMLTGYPYGGGGSMTWTIDDGIYSNSYTLNNNAKMAGVQLYIRSSKYPDISVYGPTNNTVYSTAENVTIDVTAGSLSSYRWNGGTWNSFTAGTQTNIPSTHGWHYLEIKASDPVYNNTNVVVYQYGYDATVNNLQLHNAVTGQKLPGGFSLNFSAYNVDSVTYAWDGDPTPITLLSPYDITTSMFNGLHDITVNTTDLFKTRSFNYQFYFDSDSPIISLSNVVNNTFILESKTINTQITEYSEFEFLNYSWDGGSIQNWIYDSSDIYSTVMPVGEGDHWLMVYAEDEFGHSSTKNYRFYTSPNVFSVDLKYWDNESYHYGGEDVELIIQQSNSTLYFSWNGGSETHTIVGASLVLTGANALPSVEGMQNLTIRTFNLTDVEHIFIFSFYVDRTAPEFSTNYLAYNNTRFLATAEFNFYVTDNYVNNISLIVQYSIDGKIFKSFDTHFLFPLFSYIDGFHSLEIYAKDKAGNTASFIIYFTIDTTDPVIVSVTIPDLVDDSAHGFLYVPENAMIQVLATDADSGLRTFYKWDGGPKVEFFNSFILNSATDGEAKLTIYANDTLDNEAKYFIFLVYDSSAPVVTLEWPFIFSKINDRTLLDFNVQDFSPYSIESVQYEWDSSWGSNNTNPDTDGYFSFKMEDWVLLLYDTFVYAIYGYAYANLTITVEDVLGHIDNYYYTFEVDQYPPEIALYFYNDTTFTYDPIEADGVYYLPGGTELLYNSSANDDLAIFRYYFDDDIEPTPLLDPWNFTIPPADGNHTLKVILIDTAGEGSTPNVIEANFTFIVDDIYVDYLNPDDLDVNNHITLVYNDTFTYLINVTDEVDREPIDGLQYIVSYDENINLNYTVLQLDNSTFEVTIHATNVTNGLETSISIRFYQAHPTGGQLVRVYLTIDKKEVDLSILSKSDTSVVFGENFQIYVTLQNSLFDFQTINKIIVDGTLEIADFYFNLTTMECVLNYSSTILAAKGNYSIFIRAESLYYYGNTSSETLYDLEVRPMPVILDVWVLNATILEGTPVSIYANLTLADGTPITGAQIVFTIYIYLKSNPDLPPEAIRMLFTDYDGNETRFSPTNSTGIAFLSYTINSSISSIEIEAEYLGDETRDQIQFKFDTIVVTFPPPEAEELPVWLLGLIIGGSILIAGILSFIIYKATRPKPFEELMKKITDEEIVLNYSILSPGIMLSIFDQRKGPIPLVTDHSLSVGRYLGRMQIGIENFLLKIADQAYSSLGFEEHTDERRVGSIVLPSEKMIGFLQGIQLKNPLARGGFENLSLIVLADREYGNLLLNYQEYLYPKIDELEVALKGKDSLKKVEVLMKEIRKISVIIVLAAQKAEKAQENGNS